MDKTFGLRCAAAGALLAGLYACTPGATSGVPTGGGGASAVTIDVNLTAHPAVTTPFGSAGGYAPITTTVPVGSRIRFTNSDGFSHTATLIAANGFPAGSPFSAAAQNQTGTVLSQPWSSGTLPAGASSQTITVDTAGTYFYGCFFHYGAPMRGVIVAQ